MTLKTLESPGYLALCRGPTLHFLSGSARCLIISLSQMKMIVVIVVSMIMTMIIVMMTLMMMAIMRALIAVITGELMLHCEKLIGAG